MKQTTRTLLAVTIATFASTAAWAATDATYHLQPGDVLEVSIWGEDTMRRTVLVLPDGTISYPLAGQMVVSGMTPAQAEGELKKRLIDAKYYVDPPLTVSVQETRGNQVYVIGHVRTQGAIVVSRPLDIMQTLSLVGGLDEYADRNGITVLRRDGDKQIVFRLDYKSVLSGRDLTSNVRLEPGDVIVVPEAGLFANKF